MQPVPHARLVPRSQPSPACRPRTETEVLRRVLPMPVCRTKRNRQRARRSGTRAACGLTTALAPRSGNTPAAGHSAVRPLSGSLRRRGSWQSRRRGVAGVGGRTLIGQRTRGDLRVPISCARSAGRARSRLRRGRGPSFWIWPQPSGSTTASGSFHPPLRPGRECRLSQLPFADPATLRLFAM
jgi:hypothetical protein